MGCFEYQCARGHISERRVPLAEKPAETLCDDVECDLMAHPILSATPTTFRANDRKAFKRSGR
jgi:hypothetical protein